MDDNAPSIYRKQHGNNDLVCDVAHREGIIDDGEHKDCIFLLQMREAFASKTCPRDSMLGRMVDDKAMASDTGQGSSLSQKYFSYLREIDTQTQMVLAALTSRAETTKQLWAARKAIKESIKTFSDWCHN